jgi:hypothetical protein
MSKGIPDSGDRAAEDDVNFPELHSKGYRESSGGIHLPLAGDPGSVLTSNGTGWFSSNRYFTGDISEPPTRLELDTIIGDPASVGAGFIAVIADNSGSTNEYLVWSNGTSWFYILAGSVIESSTSDSSSAYAQGSDSDVDSIPAYVLGSEDTSDSIQSFTQGLDNTSDSTTAYTEGVSE